jgi:hypothetical protein
VRDKMLEMSSRVPEKMAKPEGIEGWLQKKGSSGGVQMIQADWQRR